jgi:hypothetical protein
MQAEAVAAVIIYTQYAYFEGCWRYLRTAVWLYDCTNNCVVCHVCLARGSSNCGLYVLGGQLRHHSDRRLVRVRIFDSLLPPPRLARLRKPSPARRRPPTSQAYGCSQAARHRHPPPPPKERVRPPHTQSLARSQRNARAPSLSAALPRCVRGCTRVCVCVCVCV